MASMVSHAAAMGSAVVSQVSAVGNSALKKMTTAPLSSQRYDAPLTDEEVAAATRIQARARGNLAREQPSEKMLLSEGKSPGKPSKLKRKGTRGRRGGGHQAGRFDNAWDDQKDQGTGAKSRVAGTDAIQRTFELNKQAVDDVLLDPKDIQREQLLRVLLLDEEAKIDRGEA